MRWAFGAVFMLALLFFSARWLRWSSTVYAATDERIITQKGTLNKTYEDIPLTMITNIDLAQSLGKKVLGYCKPVFSTQSLGGRKADMVWDAVPDPMTVRRRLQEAMDVRVKPKRESGGGPRPIQVCSGQPQSMSHVSTNQNRLREVCRGAAHGRRIRWA